MTDDAELLRLYATTRSEPAFAELVRRYIDLVHTAAVRRLGGDTHTAADVTQHVFVALARHAPALARRPVLVGWLYTATRHAALDALRGAARRRQREHQAQDLHLVNASPASDDWISLRPLLDDTMDELSEPEREILLLRFFEDRSFAELGTKLALTEDAARMRTARALEKLRAHLARRGLTSTAAALATALTTQTITAAPATLAASVTSGALLGAVTATTSSLLLMTTATKTLLATAAVITTLAIGTAVYESRRADHATRALADLQRDRDTLNRQNSTLDSRLAASTADLARLAAQQKEAAIKPAPSETPKTPNANPSDLTWLNPAYGPAWVAQQSAALGMRYGQLYRELHLTPEQIAQFEKIQTEQLQSQTDIWTLAATQGLPVNGPDVARLTIDPYTRARKDIEALLGQTGVAKLDEYEKGRATREFVASLAGSVYYSDTPLTADQGTALATIITASTETKKTAMKDEGARTIYFSRKETNWESVNARVQGLLSPAQLLALKQLGEQKRFNTELQKILSPPPK